MHLYSVTVLRAFLAENKLWSIDTNI